VEFTLANTALNLIRLWHTVPSPPLKTEQIVVFTYDLS
jgi:hypothetical protein